MEANSGPDNSDLTKHVRGIHFAVLTTALAIGSAEVLVLDSGVDEALAQAELVEKISAQVGETLVQDVAISRATDIFGSKPVRRFPDFLYCGTFDENTLSIDVDSQADLQRLAPLTLVSTATSERTAGAMQIRESALRNQEDVWVADGIVTPPDSIGQFSEFWNSTIDQTVFFVEQIDAGQAQLYYRQPFGDEILNVNVDCDVVAGSSLGNMVRPEFTLHYESATTTGQQPQEASSHYLVTNNLVTHTTMRGLLEELQYPVPSEFDEYVDNRIEINACLEETASSGYSCGRLYETERYLLERLDKLWRSRNFTIPEVVIKVPVRTRAIRIDVHRHLFESIEAAGYIKGDFTETFNELVQYKNRFPSINTSELVSHLRAEKVAGETPITFFGISVAPSGIRVGGALAMVFVLLYFYLHVSNLPIAISDKEDKAWRVPWIGIYPGRFNFAVVTTTVFVIPITVLTISSYSAFESNRLESMFVLGVAFAASYFGLGALFLLHSWTRSTPKKPKHLAILCTIICLASSSIVGSQLLPERTSNPETFHAEDDVAEVVTAELERYIKANDWPGIEAMVWGPALPFIKEILPVKNSSSVVESVLSLHDGCAPGTEDAYENTEWPEPNQSRLSASFFDSNRRMDAIVSWTPTSFDRSADQSDEFAKEYMVRGIVTFASTRGEKKEACTEFKVVVDKLGGWWLHPVAFG